MNVLTSCPPHTHTQSTVTDVTNSGNEHVRYKAGQVAMSQG